MTGVARTAGTAGLLPNRRTRRRRGRALLIVCRVETRPFEDKAGPGADQTLDRTLLAFGTDADRFVRHGLGFFKAVTAFFAFVLISWHKPLLLSQVHTAQPRELFDQFLLTAVEPIRDIHDHAHQLVAPIP